MRSMLSASRSFRLHATRLREPLVQVWLMAGMSLGLVIMGHVYAVRQSGDSKNRDTSAIRLLTAGAGFQWTDDFAPTATVRPQPVIELDVFAPPAPPHAGSDPALKIDWRGEMTRAASRPWNHLGKAQRRIIDQTDRPADGLAVHLAWTGDSRGNAALHALECQRQGQPDHSSFIIGNGSRSQDGGIEIPGGLLSADSLTLEVALIGTPETLTPAQKAAFGELLNYLEARFGPVQCGG